MEENVGVCAWQVLWRCANLLAGRMPSLPTLNVEL